MIRIEEQDGWTLIAHRDHARLAGAFASRWGNADFPPPRPHAEVLLAVSRHDDAWAERDRVPKLTREGLPSAFSKELVGTYSAFEEIDLADYLAVRDRAVRLVAEQDAYAALLVSMHTYNLLTERADRSTIVPEQLPLLDSFLAGQKSLQQRLLGRLQDDPGLAPEEKSRMRIEDNFRLLQATDNLSLLSCVNYDKAATLLHPLRLKDGGTATVAVEALGERIFRLAPYPLDVSPLTVEFPARHVAWKVFAEAEWLQERYAEAEVEKLSVTITE